MPNHKIICGDCLEVMKEIPDKSIDLVMTDPPFGHNNNNGDLISRREATLGRGDYVPKRDNRPIANDGIEANELFEKFIIGVKRILTPSGGCCCCCCGGGGGPDPQFARWSMIMDKYLTFKHMVIWDKGPMGMGWHYRRSYETILIAHKGDKCKWYDTSKKIENIIRNIPKIIPSSEQHPTIKPVDLMTFFIRLHSKENDLILDPFLGSGTTSVACEQLGRNSIGIEISKDYCEIAYKRLKEVVDQTKLEGEQSTIERVGF